jgi:hypothetical protein
MATTACSAGRGGAKFALGELDDTAVSIVADADDVLSNESNVGTTGGLTEDGGVVVPLSNSALDPPTRLRGSMLSL